MTTLTPAMIDALIRVGVVDHGQALGDHNLLTAPVLLDTLNAQVEAMERYFPKGQDLRALTEWRLVDVAALPPGVIVLRWDRLTIAGNRVRSELTYALRIAEERRLARRYLRELVVAIVDDVGLRPRSKFLYPA